MKKIALLGLFIHLLNFSFSQSKNFQLQLRVPFQLDKQKAEISFSYGTEVQKATAFNFGIDALTNLRIQNFALYTGVGFFRNRFNIKREYDHQALNIGRDSLPIGTYTENYNYSLLRLPIGIEYQVLRSKGLTLGIGTEHFFNFSFKRKYNGAVPFAEANTVYNGFSYFGNSVNFFINLSKTISKNEIKFEPYMRIYNTHKKDRFLKEKETESLTRNFDAFGISIRYSFTL